MFNPSRLLAARRALDMTQADVARALHLDQSAVAHWEGGTRQPTVAHLSDLAEVLLVSADYLLGLSETPCAQP